MVNDLLLAQIDARVWQFLLLCADAGIDARLVGGAVRDVLCNQNIENLDFDIAVASTPDEMIFFCKKNKLAFFPTGLAHGTLTVRFKKLTLEVTSLRADIETSGRHATVAFGKSFEEDAKRRDFTLNALYVDHMGKLYDYFNGVRDLSAGIVRFIGDAHTRISEDYLRLYRYFRFCGRFGRGNVCLSVLPPLSMIKDELSILSIERVQRELFKILEQPWPSRVFHAMRVYGLLNNLFGDDIDFEKGVGILRKLVVYERAGGHIPCVIRRLSALVGKKDISSVLKLSKSDRQKLIFLTRQNDVDETALFNPGFYVDAALLALARLKEPMGENLKQSQKLKPLPAFPLTGADVIALGISEGEEIGVILKKIKKMWIENNFEWDRSEALNVLNRVCF